MNFEHRVKWMNADNSFASLSFFSRGTGTRILVWKKCEFNVVTPPEGKRFLFFFQKENHIQNCNATFRGTYVSSFLPSLIETARTTKTRRSQTVPSRRFVCFRPREQGLGATQTDCSVLTPPMRFCNGCSTQICKSVRMFG